MSSLSIVLLVVGLLVVLYTLIYNGLVQKRSTCENAWSQIDVQLKRRHDLIPNLVETVRGYAAHEKETLERVIQARNVASTVATGHVKEAAAAEGALSTALRQLLMVTENYPTLKANDGFLRLQEEINSTENRIAFARQHYNDSVQVFNVSVQMIPGSIVAASGGFVAKEFFELDAADAQAVKQAPKVSFS